METLGPILKTVLFGRASFNSIKKGYESWAQSTPVTDQKQGVHLQDKEADTPRRIAESLNGDGRFAAEANYGHRQLGIDRINLLRARKVIQDAVWHRDHYVYPDGTTEDVEFKIKTLGQDAATILECDEEAKVLAKHFKLPYRPVPSEGLPADLPAMNALVWLMRGAFAVGGVYVGEQTAQLLPWVEHIAYFLPVAAATVAAIPAAFSVGNAVRAVNIWRHDRQLPKVKQKN